MQQRNSNTPRVARHFVTTLSLYATLAMLAACSGGGGGGGGAVAVPVAAADSYVFDSTTPLAVPSPGVLANDSGGALTVALVSGPAHAAPASFSLNYNGSFTYTNDGSSSQPDSFTYRATNGSASSDVTTVSLAQNQPPVPANACLSTPRGVSTGGFVSVTDDGGSLTYQIVTNGAKGNVTLNAATGQFTYTPCIASTPGCPASSGTGFVGMDKFTFRATDPFGLSATATVTVLIDGAVRIMPLGDSITSGVYTSTTPLLDARVGYRRQLYNQMEALSPAYAVDFVGGVSNGQSANPAIVDPNHEGHPGFCAGPNGGNPATCASANLADNVTAYLDTNPADIILLHAGTNAFTTSASDVSLLLDQIETWQATHYPITVFVARIIESDDGSLNVTTFNNNVATMIGGRANKRYVIVNQQTGAGLTYTIGVPDGSATGPDMADNLHPNQDGYDKMATRWLTDLTNPASVGPKFVGLPQCP